MSFGGVIHLNKKTITILVCALIILFIYLHNETGAPGELEPRKINLYELLRVAIKAAENGGKEIVRIKDHIKIDNKGLTKEGQLDHVTTADLFSHCSMVQTLHHYFPSINLVSEEAKTKCEVEKPIDYALNDLIVEKLSDEYVPEEDITVWIDPLDATQEYTEKLYNYVTTMVCVAVKGKALLGVIHKPFNATTSWGWVNNAVSKDLVVENHESENEDDGVKIIVSRFHSGTIKEVLQKNFKTHFQLISAAGAGFKTLEVAKRRVNAYLHITAIKKWDICAGNAIINALGGLMTTKLNENIDYSNSDGVVNNNGLIVTMENHELFLGVL